MAAGRWRQGGTPVMLTTAMLTTAMLTTTMLTTAIPAAAMLAAAMLATAVYPLRLCPYQVRMPQGGDDKYLAKITERQRSSRVFAGPGENTSIHSG